MNPTNSNSAYPKKGNLKKKLPNHVADEDKKKPLVMVPQFEATVECMYCDQHVASSAMEDHNLQNHACPLCGNFFHTDTISTHVHWCLDPEIARSRSLRFSL